MTRVPAAQPLHIASAAAAIRHVFVRDLLLDAHIGVHRHEEDLAQPIRVNIDLTVAESGAPIEDRLENVVDYEHVVNGIRAIVAEGHLRLVETLAERVAAFALEDARVHAVRVRIEKLKIIPDAASVGVEIERLQSR
ncbi:MAG: dihydroneopterin aldolase [Micropepsaceae bacterium]